MNDIIIIYCIWMSAKIDAFEQKIYKLNLKYE